MCTDSLYVCRSQTLIETLMIRAVLLALGMGASLAVGQSLPSIERVRFGLPLGQAAQEGGCSRNHAWMPVVVTLRGSKSGNGPNEYYLRLEGTDQEGLPYQMRVPVPALDADTLRTVTGYAMPGGEAATFRVQLETPDGRVQTSLPGRTRDVNSDVIVSPDDVLIFGIGGGLAEMKRIGEKLDRPPAEQNAELNQGRRQYAFAEEVASLPDRWIGYDAVDVVVLGTSRPEFVLQLTQESESLRRNALIEWVSRGGQLVLSCGRNKQEVAQLLQQWPGLEIQVSGSEVLPSLPVISNQWCDRVNLPSLQQVEVATLTVGPQVNVLVREERRPVIVQTAWGLGRVFVVAFDLDAPPFSTWDGQEAFWRRLDREILPSLGVRARGAAAPGVVGPRPAFGDSDKYDYRAELKRGLESFEETPTISFGWVALFLLGYILLIGPLDYLVLKRIFKRLEMTWLTFPLTVLVVSVAAYWTAYVLKGDDLKINKIDVVDVDLSSGTPQMYGTSWFTLFSPRVSSYTVGIEPSSDWATPLPEGAPRPILTLLEAGDRAFRIGSQDLFRRPYLYVDDLSGITQVPIPVWATRSFTTTWRAPLLQQPPIGYTDDIGPLRLAREGGGLVGKLTNHLGVKLQGVTLIYREKCYFLDTLEPGESKRVESLFSGNAQGQGRALSEWFNDTTLSHGVPLAPSGRPISSNFLQSRDSYRNMKSMLFYRLNERPRATNLGLRRLDESWRVRPLAEYPIPARPNYRPEVVLLARTPMLHDQAEVVTAHPASPTRLWLGELPGEQRQRPALPGVLTQETYLRVFLPVKIQ